MFFLEKGREPVPGLGSDSRKVPQEKWAFLLHFLKADIEEEI